MDPRCLSECRESPAGTRPCGCHRTLPESGLRYAKRPRRNAPAAIPGRGSPRSAFAGGRLRRTPRDPRARGRSYALVLGLLCLRLLPETFHLFNGGLARRFALRFQTLFHVSETAAELGVG